MSEYLE